MDNLAKGILFNGTMNNDRLTIDRWWMKDPEAKRSSGVIGWKIFTSDEDEDKMSAGVENE